MVNIIMPAYNAHETIRKSIHSVCMQDDHENILLTIIDDCSEKPYDYLINEFPCLNIEILKKEKNTGPGQARQYGIDRCNCEYIMFLDADDYIYSPNAVSKLFNIMKEEELDLLISDFAEEMDNGEYLLHEKDGVWMHGKMYKTGYIKDKNICFNHTRTNEDSSFNNIVMDSGCKYKCLNYVTYLWKHNPNSLTRSGEYFCRSMPEFIINAEYTMTEFVRLHVDEKVIYNKFITYMITFYGYYNSIVRKDTSQSYTDEYVNNIKHFCSVVPCSIIDRFSFSDVEDAIYVHSVINNMLCNKVLFNITFYDFYNMIKN